MFILTNEHGHIGYTDKIAQEDLDCVASGYVVSIIKIEDGEPVSHYTKVNHLTHECKWERMGKWETDEDEDESLWYARNLDNGKIWGPMSYGAAQKLADEKEKYSEVENMAVFSSTIFD